MKRLRWHIAVGAALIVLSVIGYGVQIAVFHRQQDTMFYLLQDLAFLPIQVSLVTLVLNELMRLREKSALRQKMNMAIGSFFIDVGNDLLGFCCELDSHRQAMCRAVRIGPEWAEKDFQTAIRAASDHEFAIQFKPADLRALKELTIAQKPYVMELLANPSLMEHESFTDLMWATSHLTEELAYRKDFTDLPDSDYAHLAADITRAYKLLAVEWVRYARHLKDAYPYMYSLVVRVNPFNPDSSPIVTQR